MTKQADWGYNTISNGGNIENSWRTLSKYEWSFVFVLRMTDSGILFAKATVNGTSGIILLPDNWNNNTYNLNATNGYEANFSSNIISATVWANILEANGAVFLPLNGERYGNTIESLSTATYWSSSVCEIGEWSAKPISFDAEGIYLEINSERYAGFGVRLVKLAE